MRRKFSVLYAVVTALALAMSATACGSDDEVDAEGRKIVKLTAVTGFARDNVEQLAGFQAVLDAIEEEVPWVQVEYRGGPEVIPTDQIGEALRDGAVDMIAGPETYWANLVPEVQVSNLSPYAPSEERTNGAFDLSTKWHADGMNAKYLGRVGGGEPFKLYFKEELMEADLSGLQIRVSPLAVPVVETLGGEPIDMPASDVYTALERGVIDGFAWTESADVARSGWSDLAPYELQAYFYQAPRTLLMNMDKWNELDKETQDALARVVRENEDSSRLASLESAAKARSEREAAGSTMMELPPEESDKIIETAYDSLWDSLLERTPALEEMKAIYGDTRPTFGPLDVDN